MKRFLYFLFLPAMLASCSDKQEEPDFDWGALSRAEAIELSEAEEAACLASNEFGLNLLQAELTDREDNENIVLSPFSATTTLALISAAADEQFNSELAAFFNADKSSLDSYIKAVSDKLLSIDPTTKLAIANAVWYEESEQITENFRDIVATYYGGSCFSAPFINDTKGCRALINKWISDNTNGLIKNMVFPINPSTTIIVGNATYFKGLWQTAFNESDSKPGTFHSVNGNSKVTMMHHDFNTGLLYEADNFTKISLPFGNGAFVAHFVLPDEGITPLDLLKSQSLTAEVLPKSANRPYRLSLPRFKLDDQKEICLTTTLTSMGLPAICERTLTAFENQNIEFCADIYQKCTLEVNEKGAEAAAVTITGQDIAYYPSGQIDIVFDRPFLVFICEASTNTMLFAGRISQL